jgi:uncharacterized 2Fe-2S/4Fe-4S cluster protein (DUF4445 family)
MLTVQSALRRLSLPVQAGQSVRDVLDTTDLRVRAACGGNGACGACQVRLVSGAANPLALVEYQKLTPAQREAGVRLACRLHPQGDLTVAVDDPAPPSAWRSLPAEDLMPVTGGRPGLDGPAYGIAVDLGTTHVRVALWNCRDGRRIATRRGLNPQVAFGADVLNRLSAALAHADRAAELARLAQSAIVLAVRDMLKRDIGELAKLLPQIGTMVVVGNPAMIALLTGSGAAELLDPENWQHRVDSQPLDPRSFYAQWFMPQARIVLPGALSAFVGSDLLADLIATDLTSGSAGSLLLDVGTNTEIALWDGTTLHVTSVPGGPAFEGGGVRFGMPAEPGAIWRVRSLAAGGYALDTLADVEPLGFCGSGLVDAVAVLLGQGHLKPSGRFASAQGPEGLRLDPSSPQTALCGSDIDAFQRAKAATGAAMAELLAAAAMDWGDVQRLVVCGAFGHTLDIRHAQETGLLPPIDPARVELYANATLAGCERLLLAEDRERLAAEPFRRVNAINLSLAPGYDANFIDHLRLQPVPPVQKGRIPHA